MRGPPQSFWVHLFPPVSELLADLRESRTVESFSSARKDQVLLDLDMAFVEFFEPLCRCTKLLKFFGTQCPAFQPGGIKLLDGSVQIVGCAMISLERLDLFERGGCGLLG